jgi:hypothetical protein
MLSSKAQSVLQQLTLEDKQEIRKMDGSLKHNFVTERFGNESEKFGIRFCLYPLWVKEVLDELERSDYVDEER